MTEIIRSLVLFLVLFLGMVLFAIAVVYGFCANWLAQCDEDFARKTSRDPVVGVDQFTEQRRRQLAHNVRAAKGVEARATFHSRGGFRGES